MLKWGIEDVIFGGYRYRFLVGLSVILTEDFRIFPHSIPANSGIKVKR